MKKGLTKYLSKVHLMSTGGRSHFAREFSMYRVPTVLENPGKSWNLNSVLESPGKSWNF